MLVVAIVIYAVAIVIANLSVAKFGPAVTPINAFLLVGLDLALRDLLHLRLRPWQMASLIVATGMVTFALNPAAAQIAIASALAFTLSSSVDWAVFAKVRGTWTARASWSNVAGASVDSLVFPLLAFGALMPHIVVAQFIAKVLGSTLWMVVLRRFKKDIA